MSVSSQSDEVSPAGRPSGKSAVSHSDSTDMSAASLADGESPTWRSEGLSGAFGVDRVSLAWRSGRMTATSRSGGQSVSCSDVASVALQSDGESRTPSAGGMSASSQSDGVPTTGQLEPLPTLSSSGTVFSSYIDRASKSSQLDGLSAATHADQVSADTHPDGLSAATHSEVLSAASRSDRPSSVTHSDRPSVALRSDGLSAVSPSDRPPAASRSNRISAASLFVGPSDSTHSDEIPLAERLERPSTTSLFDGESASTRSDGISATSHSEFLLKGTALLGSTKEAPAQCSEYSFASLECTEEVKRIAHAFSQQVREEFGLQLEEELVECRVRRALRTGVAHKLDTLWRREYACREDLAHLRAIILHLDWAGCGTVSLKEIEQIVTFAGCDSDEVSHAMSSLQAVLSAIEPDLMARVHYTQIFDYFSRCTHSDRHYGLRALLCAASTLDSAVQNVHAPVFARVRDSIDALLDKPIELVDTNLQQYHKEFATWIQTTAATLPEPKMQYMPALKTEVRQNMGALDSVATASICVQNLAYLLGSMVSNMTAEVCEFCFGSLVHDLMDELNGSEFDRRANVEAIRQFFQVSVYPAVSSLHSWLADELRLCVNTGETQRSNLAEQLVVACSTGPLALLIQRLRGKIKWPVGALGIAFNVCQRVCAELDGRNKALCQIAIEVFQNCGPAIIDLLALDHELAQEWNDAVSGLKFAESSENVGSRRKKCSNTVKFADVPQIRTYESTEGDELSSLDTHALFGGSTESSTSFAVFNPVSTLSFGSTPFFASAASTSPADELSEAPTSPVANTTRVPSTVLLSNAPHLVNSPRRIADDTQQSSGSIRVRAIEEMDPLIKTLSWSKSMESLDLDGSILTNETYLSDTTSLQSASGAGDARELACAVAHGAVAGDVSRSNASCLPLDEETQDDHPRAAEVSGVHVRTQHSAGSVGASRDRLAVPGAVTTQRAEVGRAMALRGRVESGIFKDASSSSSSSASSRDVGEGSSRSGGNLDASKIPAPLARDTCSDRLAHLLDLITEQSSDLCDATEKLALSDTHSEVYSDISSLSGEFDTTLESVAEMGGLKFVTEWMAKQIELVWRKQLRGPLRTQRLKVLAERAVIFLSGEGRRTGQHVLYIAHAVVRSLSQVRALQCPTSLQTVAKLALLELLDEVAPEREKDEHKDKRRQIVKMVAKLKTRSKVDIEKENCENQMHAVEVITEQLAAEIRKGAQVDYKGVWRDRLRSACEHLAEHLSLKQRQEIAQKLSEIPALQREVECIDGVDFCIKHLAIYMVAADRQRFFNGNVAKEEPTKSRSPDASRNSAIRLQYHLHDDKCHTPDASPNSAIRLQYHLHDDMEAPRRAPASTYDRHAPHFAAPLRQVVLRESHRPLDPNPRGVHRAVAIARHHLTLCS
eukprot:GEMP01001956.1.p1 GENE.GEMP01001956.1~~GEMP01001956.1.p1  ORF type:complete len:1403 (+),score=325.28 GEMP01001956.1:218-4426(+)